MIVRSLTLHDDAKKIVSLNNAGECTVVQLQIDAAEFLAEYPGCGIELLIENPQGVVYRRTPERDGSMLLYTVKKTDTIFPGYGVMQLYAKGASGEERLSNKWRTYIAPSLLLEEVTEPPEPIAPMIEEAETLRDEAKAAAASAAESEQSAGGYAQQAENSAGEAAESATSAAANAEKAENAANRAETATGEIKNLSATAQTLEPGAQATADYADGVLTLGIPRGQDGAPGAPGSDASVTAENIQAALGYTPVKDVQVAGESLVQDSVATIPLAGYNRLGAIQLDPAGFAAASIEGKLALVPPTDAQISTHTHTQRPITPSCMDYALKAAMCDGKGAAWTANEQKAARERMGIAGFAEMKHIATLVTEEETNAIIVDLGKQCKICRFYYQFPEAISTGYTYVETSYTNTQFYNMSGCAITNVKYLDYIRIASALKPISLFAGVPYLGNEMAIQLKYSMPMYYTIDETAGFRYLRFTTYTMNFPKNTTIEVYAE